MKTSLYRKSESRPRQVNLRVSASQLQDLRATAVRKGVSVSALFFAAMDHYSGARYPGLRDRKG